ncbi:MAG: hypothetical protein R2844_18950 [Caldilineales bacterium]
MIVVNILAPIFLLIGLGLLLRRQGFAPESFFRQLNRLIYWVALPALLFSKMASAVPQLSAVQHCHGVAGGDVREHCAGLSAGMAAAAGPAARPRSSRVPIAATSPS